METLLECGANVHATEANGATALHGAVFHGNLEVCTLLLNAGANPTLPDKQGYTPEYLAERGGHLSQREREFLDLARIQPDRASERGHDATLAIAKNAHARRQLP